MTERMAAAIKDAGTRNISRCGKAIIASAKQQGLGWLYEGTSPEDAAAQSQAAATYDYRRAVEEQQEAEAERRAQDLPAPGWDWLDGCRLDPR